MNEQSDKERRTYSLFRAGHDTVTIAKRMNITEADAVRLLASAREKRAQARAVK